MALRTEVTGDLKWIQSLTRTIGIELWLRSLRASNATLRRASHGTSSDKLPPGIHRADKLRMGAAEYSGARVEIRNKERK